VELHVAKSGSDTAAGTAEAPLLTIGAAAALAQPGDTVVVHEGVYREWVNPPRGGTAAAPITYQAALGADGLFETVTISGAEVIADWHPHAGSAGRVWVATVPNSLFGSRNPYLERIGGDWFFDQVNTWHTGEVYLDGKSLYESLTMAGVEHPEVTVDSFDQAGSLLTWYCEVGDDVTTIWANFGGADPAEHQIEINARTFVFWPAATGIDHITVRGFTLTKAATQWAPPTALQEGLIGPHWSKGWVIEDNTITDSKNVGVSLGKEASTGQNEAAAGPKGAKGGTQREREVIQRALALRGPAAGEPHPWDRDHVGSHTVRRNTIRDCEQAGIVGHLGAAFSTISDNHISRIHVKRQWHGAEVAGIKLHAAIDTVISGNTIHHTHRALWLDWQAQGTLVRRNVFYASTAEDFMVEVCHGPYLVDSNLFLSPWAVKDMSTGGAYVHNYIAGRIANCTEHQRYTPYHLPALHGRLRSLEHPRWRQPVLQQRLRRRPRARRAHRTAVGADARELLVRRDRHGRRARAGHLRAHPGGHLAVRRLPGGAGVPERARQRAGRAAPPGLDRGQPLRGGRRAVPRGTHGHHHRRITRASRGARHRSRHPSRRGDPPGRHPRGRPGDHRAPRDQLPSRDGLHQPRRV
jgi:hypothetical protein